MKRAQDFKDKDARIQSIMGRMAETVVKNQRQQELILEK